MKTLLKTTGIWLLILVGALTSGAAMADRDDHDGRGYAHAYHHGYHRGYDHDEGRHVHFGMAFGMPFYDSGFYPPYFGNPWPTYVSPPVVVVRPAPPVYVEQGQAVPAPAPSYWYYCAASRTYYPYVSQCPAGWQRVPAQPPAQ